ncbi:hypothetical protein BJ741DRAFT_599288 [Chytriomyces cf. hyalinus JEL632]|nr:hypothetical protein BJ741DRAFT_599288 [Chytriomyces cf. hyalinus JEL632]
MAIHSWALAEQQQLSQVQQQIQLQYQTQSLTASRGKHYGGLDVDKVVALAPKPKKMIKSQLGAVDLYNVSMSLQSDTPIDVTSAINILTILSHDREVVLKLPDFPPLGHALVGLFKKTHLELQSLLPKAKLFPSAKESDIIPLKTLMHLEAKSSSLSVGKATGLKSSRPDARKGLMERLIALLSVFRNLTVTLEPNQKFLATHIDFPDVLFGIFAVSPLECVSQDEDEGENDADVFRIDCPTLTETSTPSYSSLNDPDTEEILFYEAPTLCLELRRLAFANLVNMSAQSRLPNVTTAQTCLNIIRDTLETHAFYISTPCNGFTWSSPCPYIGDDLSPHFILEGLSKLTVDLGNADLLSECEGIESLLHICVDMLPSCGGFVIVATVDDVISWELALTCLYYLVLILDGAPGEPPKQLLKEEAVAKSIPTPTSAILRQTSRQQLSARGIRRRYSSLGRVPRLVPLLLSLMRRPQTSVAAASAQAVAQFDPLCMKACRVLVEGITRGGEEARRAVKRFESSIVGIGVDGAAGAGMSEDIWKRLHEVLYMLNDGE